MPDKDGKELAEKDEVPKTPLHAHAEGREDDVEGTPTPEVGEEGDRDKGVGNPVDEEDGSDAGSGWGESPDPKQIEQTDNPSKGSLHADNPEIGGGTGEGDAGLGVHTDAAGGDEPTEPEGDSPERRQDRG